MIYVNPRQVYGRDRIAILSNSAGSADDLGYEMAKQTEAALGLPVIRHATKKPACFHEVIK